jgi:hypothetical protein
VPVDTYAPELRAELVRQWADELTAFFERMRDGWDDDPDGWRNRLEDVVRFNGKATATAFGKLVASGFVNENGGRYWTVRFRPDLMDAWIETVSFNLADSLVGTLVDTIAAFGLVDAFDQLLDVQVPMYADTFTGTFGQFGAHEGATAAGARLKQWQVNSSNPRDSHTALDGETVELSEVFSNGMRWPGDPAGGADEVANCQCSMVFP